MTNRIFGNTPPTAYRATGFKFGFASNSLFTSNRIRRLGFDWGKVLREHKTRNTKTSVKSQRTELNEPPCNEFDFEIDARWL